jgi:hypothetical protein
MIYHVTAGALGGLAPLRAFEPAARAWRALSAALATALAAVLMPTHLHLLVAAADPDELRRGLGALLSGLTRSGAFGPARRLWEPVPPPEPVPDRCHLRRLVRYLALNPCRDGLCADPLSWLWSTHRDVMGAAVEPWVTPERLAAALRESPRGFAAAHHAYVAADPTVDVNGTPPPRPAPARETPVVAPPNPSRQIPPFSGAFEGHAYPSARIPPLFGGIRGDACRRGAARRRGGRGRVPSRGLVATRGPSGRTPRSSRAIPGATGADAGLVEAAGRRCRPAAASILDTCRFRLSWPAGSPRVTRGASGRRARAWRRCGSSRATAAPSR